MRWEDREEGRTRYGSVAFRSQYSDHTTVNEYTCDRTNTLHEIVGSTRAALQQVDLRGEAARSMVRLQVYNGARPPPEPKNGEEAPEQPPRWRLVGDLSAGGVSPDQWKLRGEETLSDAHEVPLAFLRNKDLTAMKISEIFAEHANYSRKCHRQLHGGADGRVRSRADLAAGARV